jgi:hypothetical protein
MQRPIAACQLGSKTIVVGAFYGVIGELKQRIYSCKCNIFDRIYEFAQLVSRRHE